MPTRLLLGLFWYSNLLFPLNLSSVRIRSICLAAFLVATAAFGATGEYEQTRDGKTTVWNGNPKPGESASWAGDRNKDGYATGFGTITWYTAQGNVYAVYYGNMVNGKFEGPVNVHTGGRTAHAYFADGGRVTAWARGAAPSRMNVPEELVAKRRKAESEPPKPREKRTEPKKEIAQKPTPKPETTPPVEQPQKPAVAVTTATPAEVEKVSPPPASEPVAVSTPSPPEVAETSIPTPEPTQSSSLFEAPRIAETHETPNDRTTEMPPASTPETTVEQTPAPVEESPTPAETPKRADGSLNALTGPPSSLRESSTSEPSSAPTAQPKARSGSSKRGVADLSEDEAIGLADAEARSRGYDVSQYQRPKADYSAVKDKWSLFYTLKDPKAAGGDLQPFSVTVEDKTKRVEIRRNY